MVEHNKVPCHTSNIHPFSTLEKRNTIVEMDVISKEGWIGYSILM